MESLSPEYLAELARQIAFVSAFLGGFAATFLATLVLSDSPKRVAGWTIVCLAFSACGFVVAVVSSVMLVVVLNPDVPSNVAGSSSIVHARIVSVLSFVIAIYALLTSVGMSGWLRSRKIGVLTSLAGGLGVVLVTWAIVGSG